MTAFKPHKYQEIAINHIITHPEAALLLDMGMGKTVSTLTAIDDLLYDYFMDIGKVLIIAPLRVAKKTWTDEIEKWPHLHHFKVSKIIGTKKQRLEALKIEADIYLINRENVVWLVEELGQDWCFDTVAIDELSSFKSSKSKRFRALKKVRPLFKRVIGLTGTPGDLLAMWAQMYLIDRGEALGKTFTSYKDKYFIPLQRNGHIVYKWGLKEDAESEIYSRLEENCISMKAVDWLDMPERIDNVVSVYLPDKVMRQYQEFERHQIIALDDADIVAVNAGVVTNKLLQFANGAIYDDERNVVEIHDEKLKALEDIVDEAQGRPVMVFYNFIHDKERIEQHFKQLKPRTLESDADQDDWNAGKIPLLLVHPASAGHGLNLQSGGSTIVWFGLNWSLELYQQANARLWRQGQTETVIIHHIIAAGTRDELVLKVMAEKDATQNELIEAVKVEINKVRNEIKEAV